MADLTPKNDPHAGKRRRALVVRAREVLDLAWEIGGARGQPEGAETQLRIQNGLMALVIVETWAPPADPIHSLYSAVRLSSVLDND